MKFLKAIFAILVVLITTLMSLNAKDIHVSKAGNDSNDGNETSPLFTISKAAIIAIAGDVVIVHQGTYREYINSPKGGTSDSNRIIFKVPFGEEVFVKGSEVINTWVNNGDNTWKVTLLGSFFNGYNPYYLKVDGDYQNYGQWHHRGDVYLNNGVLSELQTLKQVKTEPFTWFTSTSGEETTIYANFGTVNPNTELAEINVRELIFFATRNDVDFLTVDGFRFLHAAPNWQAPNTGSSDSNRLNQVGAVGCNMGKGWVIENCELMYSKTAGIMMGESAGNQNTFEDINAFGDHTIRNNIVHRCGEYGIAGQKGLSRSTISGNRIEDINFRNEFGGFETAGIKSWNNVDVLIENNLIRNCIANQNSSQSQAYCIWIDYANQGTRITRNFLVGSSMTTTALFLEANIGPTLVDNNILIDRTDKAIQVFSGGSVFAHNLFINSNFSFAIQQFDNGGSGARKANTYNKHTLQITNSGQKVEIVNNKMYNNIFAGGDGPKNFSVNSGSGNLADYNLYLGGTLPSGAHTNSKTSNFGFSHTITDTPSGIDFSFTIDNSFENISTPYVNSTLVGIIPLANQSIEDKNGKGIIINTDINMISRTSPHPRVGPFEDIFAGKNTFFTVTNKLFTPGLKYAVPVSIPPTEEVGIQAPYKGTPASIPGIIEAENYDTGGQGVAFNDDAIKEGNLSIRPGDNVDLGSDGGIGVVVAWFNPREWLEYTVNIELGNYNIDLFAASALTSQGILKISIADKEIASINVSGTNGWNTYKSFSTQNVVVQAAKETVLRITTSGGFNLDKITFTKTGSLTSSSTPEDILIFKIFPNPTNEILNVECVSANLPSLKIYSLDGELLLSEKAKRINVSCLTNGMYLLSVDEKQNTMFVKN
jgi:hypothetical protein